MTSGDISPALTAILGLLEDETTDDLTKWRNLCFTQLTRLRFTEFHHFHAGLAYEKTSTDLTTELRNVSSRLTELTSIEENLKQSLAAAIQIEQQITATFQRFNTATASEGLLQVQLDRAPETFSEIYDSHRATRLQNLQRLFRRVNKKVIVLSASVARIETKVQAVNRLVKKRRDEIARAESHADGLRSEISDLRKAFSDVALPAFPPEVTAISTQFENSVEASKKLLAIERQIAELEANMQRVHLDNRPSQCGALEDLIEKQKASQRSQQRTLLERYKTDEIEAEIEEARKDVEQGQAELRSLREATEAECASLNERMQQQNAGVKERITENSAVIQRLREEIAQLSDQVPTPSRATKISVATETFFREPRFF
jgi:DNA repair exonuclease SbcCD ATPase subunit